MPHNSCHDMAIWVHVCHDICAGVWLTLPPSLNSQLVYTLTLTLAFSSSSIPHSSFVPHTHYQFEMQNLWCCHTTDVMTWSPEPVHVVSFMWACGHAGVQLTPHFSCKSRVIAACYRAALKLLLAATASARSHYRKPKLCRVLYALSSAVPSAWHSAQFGTQQRAYLPSLRHSAHLCTRQRLTVVHIVSLYRVPRADNRQRGSLPSKCQAKNFVFFCLQTFFADFALYFELYVKIWHNSWLTIARCHCQVTHMEPICGQPFEY